MEAVEETVVTVGELPEGEMQEMELIEQKPNLETVIVNTSEPTIGDILAEAEDSAMNFEDDKENDGKGRSNWHRYNAKRRYQPSWEEHFPWVCRAKPGAEYAFCKVCKKTLLPKISVLHSHDKGVKHLKRYNALIMEGGAMPGVGEILDPTTGMIQSGPVGEIGENEEMIAGMEAEVASQNTMPMGFKQEIIDDPNDPKFILSSIANAMEIGTVVDVLGPMLFNRFSIWDLMLKKARLTYNVHAMDAVVRDTESILLELKLLLENCFDHLDEKHMGRGVRNQKKGMPSVEISELLSNAIDVNSGQWYQRELEGIRYRNGLDSGILTPVVKQQPKDEDDCGDKSPDFKPPRGVGRPPGRRGRKPKVRLADMDEKPRKEKRMVLDKNDPDYEARMKVPGIRSKEKAICNKCGKSFFGETVKKHEEKCQVQRLLKYRKEGITFFCAYEDCPNPETGYKSKEILLEHFDNFHFTDEDRTIPCTYETCAFKFATISQRNGHIRKNHDKQFACTKCDKQFWVEKSLVDHVEKVHNRLPGDEIKVKETALCRKCGKALSKASLQTHEAKCDGLSVRAPEWKKVGEEYICTSEGCTINHGFSTFYGLRVHFFESHLKEKEKVYECEYCERKFACKIARNKHVKASHIKPYVCDHCGARFGAKNKLAEHKLTHTGEKPYACDKCDYRSAKKFNLVDHKQKRHNDTNGRNYYCGLCGKVFITPGRLTSHFRIVHQDGQNVEGTKKKARGAVKKVPQVVQQVVQMQQGQVVQQVSQAGQSGQQGARTVMVHPPQIIVHRQGGETTQAEQEIAVDFITNDLI